MRIALLSNVTTDLLVDKIKPMADIYIPPGFDVWQQEIINRASGLYAYKPEVVVLLLYADAYADLWNDRKNGCSIIEEWAGMIKTLCVNLPGTPVFVSSIDITNVSEYSGLRVHVVRR